MFTIDNNHQGRCLYPAYGRQVETAALAVERGHRASAVDTHQPVCFATAARCIGQGLHFLVASQMGKSVSDRCRCHRLQPQPRGRLGSFCGLGDKTENELAFTPGVAGIDQLGYVFAFDQFGQHLEPRFALGNRIQLKVWRNDREMRE